MDPILDPEERDLEEGLMRAGRNVAMSPELRDRTLTALAAGAVGVTAASTAKAGTWGWLSSKAAGLWVAGLVTVGGAVALVAGESQQELPQNTPAAPAESAQTPREIGAIAPPKEEPPAEPPGPEPSPVVDAAVDPATPKGAPATTTKRSGAVAEGTTTLRDELSHISQVEAALQAGNANKALSLLAEYRQRFAQRRLGLEAEILTIQALHKSGAVAEAQARAQRFVSAHPKSPLSVRAKQFLR